MIIRRFEETDAKEVSDLIRKTLMESNSTDYPENIIEELVERHTPEYIKDRAGWTHFYVASEKGQIIGCGAIGPYWDKEDESALFSLFVLPEIQKKGVGKALVETLEQDEYARRAKRIEIAASITGLEFYKKLGYEYKNGIDEPDEELLYRLEKYRK